MSKNNKKRLKWLNTSIKCYENEKSKLELKDYLEDGDITVLKILGETITDLYREKNTILRYGR